MRQIKNVARKSPPRNAARPRARVTGLIHSPTGFAYTVRFRPLLRLQGRYVSLAGAESLILKYADGQGGFERICAGWLVSLRIWLAALMSSPTARHPTGAFHDWWEAHAYKSSDQGAPGSSERRSRERHHARIYLNLDSMCRVRYMTERLRIAQTASSE